MKTLNAQVVLCDIEGTTTSISFVKDILFPFSKDHLEIFLVENSNNPEVNSIFKNLQQSPDYKGNYYETINDISIAEITKFVIFLIDNDKKLGALKSLQGLIWKQGYDNNLIKSHIYPDIPNKFNKWSQNKIKIFIYSSGSVQAQKLLFQNSIYGDLMPLISGYFDTKIGNKQEFKSYENILKELNVSADKVIFFTDIVKEAKSAAFVGINSILVDRPGNASFTEKDKNCFVIIKSFDEIELINDL